MAHSEYHEFLATHVVPEVKNKILVVAETHQLSVSKTIKFLLLLALEQLENSDTSLLSTLKKKN